jgi:cell division protein FtsW (lipid II flippase)
MNNPTPQSPMAGSTPSTEPMSVKDWVITLLITYIPLVGLIMLLVWAFDNTTNLNKKNFAKASLLWMLIGIILTVIIFALFMGAFFSMMDSMNSYD